MRTLRAVAARGGSWALLVAVVAVGVSGAIVVAAAQDARGATSLPLLLVLALVVANVSTELARRRRAEVSLVRVRGAYGPWLLSSVAGQSLLAVLAGLLAGLAIGSVALQTLHGRWDVPPLVGGREIGYALLVAGLAAVPAVGAAAAVASEPLAVALRRSAWSGPTGRWAFAGLVAGIAVALAAVLSVYRADTDDPGTLVLAGPGLIGVAVGQVVVWLHRAVGRRAGTASRSSLGLLLGLRRALAADHANGIRALVAAGCVAAAALCAVTATDDWADETARIGSGAPLRLAMPDASALQTLQLTEQVDPDGRWLMAAALNDQRVEPEHRIAWLDLERYDRVAGAHLAGTKGDVADHVDRLRDAPRVAPVTGDRFEVTTNLFPVSIRIDYLDDDGVVSSAALAETGSAPVDDCSSSCVVLGVEADQDVTISELRLGSTDLLPAFGDGPITLTAADVVRPLDATAPEPVVSAGVAALPTVEGIGGSSRDTIAVAEQDAVPLLYGAGAVADLRVGLAGAGGSIPAVSPVVLARADTPQDVLDALVAAGAGKPRDWQPATRELSRRELAEERVGRVTLVVSVLLGALVLLAGRRRRTAAAVRERAALRLVGVPRAVGRRAGRVEAALLALVVGVPTYLAAWLATTTVVDGAGLVVADSTGLPFGTVVAPALIGSAAAVTAVAVVVGLVLVRVAARRGSEPAVLLTEPEPG